MKELGLQAAARIAASSEPLRALTQMAQNFPNLAAALSRVAVPKQLRSELKKLHRVLQGGARHICSPELSSVSKDKNFCFACTPLRRSAASSQAHCTTCSALRYAE